MKTSNLIQAGLENLSQTAAWWNQLVPRMAGETAHPAGQRAGWGHQGLQGNLAGMGFPVQVSLPAQGVSK